MFYCNPNHPCQHKTKELSQVFDEPFGILLSNLQKLLFKT